MATKLTERAIERLECPADRRDRLVFDAEQRGLAVRIMRSGSRSYLCQYAFAGRKHRVPLGAFNAISLATARLKAREVMGQVAGGGHPARDRKAATVAEREASNRDGLTLQKLVEDGSACISRIGVGATRWKRCGA